MGSKYLPVPGCNHVSCVESKFLHVLRGHKADRGPLQLATGGDARTPPSDNDERPVREQLKETTIDAAAVNDAVECASNGSGTEQSSGRKRSFEESRDEDDEAANNNEGPRKRSREATPEVAKVSAEDKNVSEPTPKDPEPATLPKLATDESSHGNRNDPDIEYIITSDVESEESLVVVEPAPREASPEVVLVSDSESEPSSDHWIQIIEAPCVEGGFENLNPEEGESDKTPSSPSGASVQEKCHSSVNQKWLECVQPSPESSRKSKLSGARTDRPADFPAESPSCGQDAHFLKNDNTNTSTQGTENKDSAKTMKEEEAQVIKKKRSLDQVEDEGAKKSEETETKRHRDNSQEREAQTANVSANHH